MLLRTVPTALICAGLYVFLVSKLIMVMVMVHDQDLVMVCDEKVPLSYGLFIPGVKLLLENPQMRGYG